MASKRKPNNTKARMDRTMRGLLRQHRACIVDASGPEIQVMLHYNSGRQILSSQVADALRDIAHQWTIYLSVLCIDQTGTRYIKSAEVLPKGIYRAERLTEVIETQHLELVAECNPKHVVSSAWIAIPDRVSLDEAHAAKIYDAVSAWVTQSAA